MNYILMTAPIALSTQQGSKTQTRRDPKNLTAIANTYIGQNATEDTPAFTFALKGEKLLIIDIVDKDHFLYPNGYRYVCQDIEKRYGGFYVKADEITLSTKYKISEVLWVREPAKVIRAYDSVKTFEFKYLSDGMTGSLHIPNRFLDQHYSFVDTKWLKYHKGIPNGCIREMARTFIRIVDVRLERLNEISDEDAIAEGAIRVERNVKGYTNRSYHMVEYHYGNDENLGQTPSDAFGLLWESIYGNGSFDNKLVEVYVYELVENVEPQP